MFVFAQKHEKGVSLRIYVQPGASKTEFAGAHDEALKIRIAARPTDGAANKALCEFLAEFFQITKNSVRILNGQSSRKKIVVVEGVADEILLILQKHEKQLLK